MRLSIFTLIVLYNNLLMEVFVWLALETALLANPGSWLSDDIRVFVGRTCNMAWVFLRSSFPFLMLSRKKLKLRYIYVHKYTRLLHGRWLHIFRAYYLVGFLFGLTLVRWGVLIFSLEETESVSSSSDKTGTGCTLERNDSFWVR